jgi:hypothetical protein
LPLVSDLGAGLAKLVRDLNLTWKHCHRHLIESVGANSRTGGWVRRLLLCSSLEEARRAARIIWQEIMLLPLKVRLPWMKEARYERLLNMLQDVLNPGRAFFLARWARWERLGCPTTTNAIESVHARLNDLLRKEKSRTFQTQLMTLKGYLWKRFENRNSKKRKARRSVNRYRDEMGKPGFSEPTEEPAMSCRAFYRALHSPDPEGQFWMNAQWEYPPFFGPTDLHFGFAQSPVTDDLPDGWNAHDANLPPEPEEDSPPANDEVDTPDHCLPLPAAWHTVAQARGHRIRTVDENPEYTAIAWNLIHSVRRLRFNGKWTDDECQTTVSYVFSVGGRCYYPGDHLPLSEDEELAWRRDVLTYFKIADLV